MENFIKHIAIENFKSIKRLEINDCARINLFIGKPNVGKSNIIDALSLLSIPAAYDGKVMPENRIMDLLRVESTTQLFHYGITENNAIIKTDLFGAVCNFSTSRGLKIHFYNQDADALNINITEKNGGGVFYQDRDTKEAISQVKRYIFSSHVSQKTSKKNQKQTFLTPPYGNNLLQILQLYPDLKEEIGSWFEKYGLKLVFDLQGNELRVLREIKDEVFILPYSAIADTLRRVIFFKAAIVSNLNSILLFEEPEAHAFPPYIAKITQEIIASETNQYFITTHSPYILNDFLERREPELAIYMVNYKNHETVVKRLTDKELDEVYQYGIDLFFNNEYFW